MCVGDISDIVYWPRAKSCSQALISRSREIKQPFLHPSVNAMKRKCSFNEKLKLLFMTEAQGSRKIILKNKLELRVMIMDAKALADQSKF